ncbi:MAG: N-acetylmuramoyl-L-alanine amidase [Syntrophobacteraceae bacterium]
MRKSAGVGVCLGVLIVGFMSIAVEVGAQTVEELYSSARNEYRSAFGITEKDRKIETLRRCIQQLEEVEKADTQGSLAAKRLYLTGQCYHLIYDAGKRSEDREAALQHYRLVVEKHPENPLADDAQYLKGVVLLPEDPTQALVELKKVSLFFPGGDSKPKAVQVAAQLERQLGCKDNPKKAAESALPQVAVSPSLSPESGGQTEPGGAIKPEGVKARTVRKSESGGDKSSTKCPAIAELQNIQHWSGEDYTRVAVYTSTPVSFQEQAYLQDAKRQKPAQILVDLKGCAVNPRLGSPQKVNDTFLEGINAIQLDGSKTRIVLDARSLDRYRIFTLSDPFRIIVDIQGKKAAQQASIPSSPAPPPPSLPPQPQPKKPSTDRLPSLARQLGLEVNRIVLDPGHGGKDKGATGPGGIHEKNVTLAIAFELKSLIEEKLNCQVLLTRTKDRFVSLEERTAFANAHKADLFISIHTNANPDKSLTGTETYFLNFSKDKESARVAALENATSAKRISDLETILHDLMRNTKIKESSQLATAVHRQVVKHIRAKEQERVRDLGVKQAPFCVLIGAEMPCILIETAFITNPKEEARLKDKEFQQELAKGIASGLEIYMRQIKSLAQAGDRP